MTKKEQVEKKTAEKKSKVIDQEKIITNANADIQKGNGYITLKLKNNDWNTQLESLQKRHSAIGTDKKVLAALRSDFKKLKLSISAFCKQTEQYKKILNKHLKDLATLPEEEARGSIEQIKIQTELLMKVGHSFDEPVDKLEEAIEHSGYINEKETLVVEIQKLDKYGIQLLKQVEKLEAISVRLEAQDIRANLPMSSQLMLTQLTATLKAASDRTALLPERFENSNGDSTERLRSLSLG